MRFLLLLFLYIGTISRILSLSSPNRHDSKTTTVSRRSFVRDTTTNIVCIAVAGVLPSKAAVAKCTDMDSCREIGERKDAEERERNPVTILPSGVRYKQLKPGFGQGQVPSSKDDERTVVDLIYSVSMTGRGYMYSQGFGFEKIDVGNGKLQSDLGLDSYRVPLGKGGLPLGVEEGIIGMKKGERRRIEVPPNVGFDTSDWKPEPSTRGGKQMLQGYKTLIRGVGSSRPPFPAPTIWDVEILSFRTATKGIAQTNEP